MNRRGFLSSILALGAAPAIVRADSLMRVVPRETTVAFGIGQWATRGGWYGLDDYAMGTFTPTLVQNGRETPIIGYWERVGSVVMFTFSTPTVMYVECARNLPNRIIL